MNFESDSLAARRRRVVFYGRVSTEMEAQIAALKNQMIWYQQLAERHPEWTVVTMYEDEGISGRSINNRPGFMKMLADAKKRKFDLIVTREVSRFARNTVDALVVTRELKTYGVEVYFVNDDIWTMNGDGELRLTIMASLAQEESRKFSERVRAGIKIAQGKGRYFAGWRPYGYTNDSANKTLVVREDEAEVVRRIYAMHAAGIGSTSIAKRLSEERIPNYAGEFQWKEGQVYEILRNPIYKGYKTTNKEHVSDYLSQTIIKHDKSEYVYVKCDFEPIIPEQEWEACQRRLKRASAFLDGGVSEAYLYGKSENRDKWACRMFCACGARMRAATRNKAHEANYLCYRKLKIRRADKSKPMPAWQRVDCKASYVAQWKLELMAKEIFQQVWKDHKQEILDYYREENEKNAISPDHSEEIEKKKQLIEKTQNDRQEVDSMYRQNLIPLSTYQNICDRYDACIRHAQEDLAALESKPRFYDLKKIEESLNWEELFPDGYVSREFLDRFVSRIFAVDAQRFVWELNLSQKSYSMECGVIGTFRFPYVTTQELEEKPAADKKRRGKKKGDDERKKYHNQKTVSSDGLYLKMIRGDIPTHIWAQADPCTVVCRLPSSRLAADLPASITIKLNYEQARAYRNSRGYVLWPGNWKDLTVKVLL